ncbi:MAG TPA: carbohydrate ABC transporter permease [Acidobacteriota bacterium]|nr:carbohydrate ABC transporter permease [Acidobacteriota bacterium]
MKRVGIICAVALVTLFSVGPFVWIVGASLKTPATITARPPTIVPDFATTFYETAFGEHNILRYALNSAIVAGTTTLITIVLAALAAYPLARLRLRRRGVILGIVLGASMFPQIAIVGGVYRMLSHWGLLNTYPGLILPYTALALPLAIWILTVFFRALPRELEEAAIVDGCGPVATLRRVFIPLAAPGIFTAAILVFIQSWNEFFFALLITTDPSVQTLPVGIAKFPGQYMVPWGELAAAAVVATVPLVIVVLVLQRRITSGLTAGAVKG